MVSKKLNILFICKSNLFRSKISEYYLRKINKNVNVESAGIVLRNKMGGSQNKAIKDLGIILKGKPKPLTSNLLKKQDLIIIVARDVPKGLFNKSFLKSIRTKARVIKWGISDIYDLKGLSTEERTKKTVNKLIKRIDKLNSKLKKGKWKL